MIAPPAKQRSILNLAQTTSILPRVLPPSSSSTFLLTISGTLLQASRERFKESEPPLDHPSIRKLALHLKSPGQSRSRFRALALVSRFLKGNKKTKTKTAPADLEPSPPSSPAGSSCSATQSSPSARQSEESDEVFPGATGSLAPSVHSATAVESGTEDGTEVLSVIEDEKKVLSPIEDEAKAPSAIERDELDVDSEALPIYGPKNYTPPCQTLPFEILRLIFIQSLTPFHPPMTRPSYHSYVRSPNLKKEPMSFTYVCSWWRAVALGVPELWVAVCGGPEWSRTTTPGVMRVWMHHVAGIVEKQTREEEAGRTGMRLDLHLAVPRGAESQYAEIRHMRKTIPIFWDKLPFARSLHLVLDKHALSEWQKFFIRALPPSPTLPTPTLTLTPALPSPYLEDIELILTTSAAPHTPQINTLISWLATLPSIRRLKWHYTPTQLYPLYTHTITALPWARLTEAVITSPISFVQARTCLAACVSASTVKFLNMGWLVPPPDVLLLLSQQHGVCTLPNLTTLSLGDSSSPAVLLSFFSLPALKRLWIRKETPMPHSYFHRLQDFFERSGCVLERLTIRDAALGVGWARPEAWAREEVGGLLGLAATAGVEELDLVFEGAWARVEEMFEWHLGQEQTREAWSTLLRTGTIMAWGPRTTTNAKSRTEAGDVEQHVGWVELQEGDDRELRYTIEGGVMRRCEREEEKEKEGCAKE